MTIVVDLGRKATKQKKKNMDNYSVQKCHITLRSISACLTTRSGFSKPNYGMIWFINLYIKL